MKKEYKKSIAKIIKADKNVNLNNPERGIKINDGYSGTISFNNNAWQFIENRNQSNFNNRYETIVFILESPHIKEFNSAYNYPLAKVTTYFLKINDFINAAIQKNIINLNIQSIYQIYFINAIQYQCSLGKKTEYYRDLVFLYYWDSKKNDFIKRLKNISKTMKVICYFNACTVGNHEGTTTIFNSEKNIYENIWKKCGPRFLKKIMSSSAKNLNDMINKYVTLKTKLTPVQCHHPAAWIHNKFF